MIFNSYQLLDAGPVNLKFINNGVDHREARMPGAGISDLPADAQAAISAHWTAERLAAFEEPTLTTEQQEARALNRLASRRYSEEVKGIVIRQVNVDTDRETQSKLVAVRILAKEDAEYFVKWKTSRGFVTLDASTIIALADAVRGHVQTCYDRESELATLIEEAEDPTRVDISTGWP